MGSRRDVARFARQERILLKFRPLIPRNCVVFWELFQCIEIAQRMFTLKVVW